MNTILSLDLGKFKSIVVRSAEEFLGRASVGSCARARAVSKSAGLISSSTSIHFRARALHTLRQTAGILGR